ncbi:MAG: alpha/beta fold hydrolase [Pirellulales bacterium]|nr:alpha/beta fold hydrolase [Pirellulales bacterium]
MSSTDWRSLYPFASHELRLDGFRYHYLDEGAGPVLLLAHGNPTWSFFWREIVTALRGEFRLIVPDHIGCGLSEKPSPAEYSYRLARRVADLNRLVQDLDLREITLVAHDWGGAIGMGAAVKDPGRFARFVLMNTGAFRASSCPWKIRLCRIPVLGQLAVQGLNLFVKAALTQTTAKPERMTPAIKAGFSDPYDSWANRAAVYRFVQDIPLKPSHPSYQTLVEIENGLAQFRDRPACLIWGMQDWCFTPWFLEKFREFLPQAEVHRIADAGHYVVQDSPEEVVRIMREFLRKEEG